MTGEQDNYHGPDRRSTIVLSEEQLDAIAERAVEKVLDRFHQEVGKVAVRAILYVLGMVGITVLGWLGLEKLIK